MRVIWLEKGVCVVWPGNHGSYPALHRDRHNTAMKPAGNGVTDNLWKIKDVIKMKSSKETG